MIVLIFVAFLVGCMLVVMWELAAAKGGTVAKIIFGVMGAIVLAEIYVAIHLEALHGGGYVKIFE